MDAQKKDEIIAEVAKRHHLLLDKDDPALILVTINELMLQGYIEKVNALLQEAQNQIILGAEEQILAARKVSEGFITEAAKYLNERSKETSKVLITDIMNALEKKLQEISKKSSAIEMMANKINTSTILALSSGAISLLSAGVIIGSKFL